jgi:hypothetical protein
MEVAVAMCDAADSLSLFGNAALMDPGWKIGDPPAALKSDDTERQTELDRAHPLYFGFSDDEPCYLGHTPGPCDSNNEPATTFQPWVMNTTEAVLSKKLDQPGLLYVGGSFWGKRVTNCTLGQSSCGIRLKPTWEAEWAARM